VHKNAVHGLVDQELQRSMFPMGFEKVHLNYLQSSLVKNKFLFMYCLFTVNLK